MRPMRRNQCWRRRQGGSDEGFRRPAERLGGSAMSLLLTRQGSELADGWWWSHRSIEPGRHCWRATTETCGWASRAAMRRRTLGRARACEQRRVRRQLDRPDGRGLVRRGADRDATAMMPVVCASIRRHQQSRDKDRCCCRKLKKCCGSAHS